VKLCFFEVVMMSVPFDYPTRARRRTANAVKPTVTATSTAMWPMVEPGLTTPSERSAKVSRWKAGENDAIHSMFFGSGNQRPPR